MEHQVVLEACDRLGEGGGVVELLEVRKGLRALHSQCTSLQQTTTLLSRQHLNHQQSVFAVNQRHNSLQASIMALQGRRFEAVSAVGFVIDESDNVLEVLRAELEARIANRTKLSTKKAELEATISTLDKQLEKQSILHQRLQAWLSATPTAHDLLSLLNTVTENISIKTVFEECCREEEPCWQQLRFYSVGTDTDNRDGRDDSLFKPHQSGDYLRFQLSEQVKLTVTANGGELNIKMDASEYKWASEEEAEQWLRPIIANRVSSARDLITVLNKIKQVYQDEDDLAEECSSRPFDHLQKISTHTWQFSVSDLQNTATVTVTTAPRHWTISVQPTVSDDVFTSRCKLVQERLNNGDMIVAPITLQLAFLRKLV